MGCCASDRCRSVSRSFPGYTSTGRTRSCERIVELVPDQRLSYALESGLPLRGYRADVDLEPNGDGTKLRYDADAQVGGKIASIGQRLLDTSVKAIAKQSLEGLHANIKIRHSAAPRDASPPEGAAAPKQEEAAPIETPVKDTGEAPRGKAPLPVVKVDEKAFAASVAMGKPFPVPTSQMLEVVSAFEAIIQSASERRPVPVVQP